MNMIDFLSQLFALLNAETPYAVLRNFEGLPTHNPSRDIDFAIERADFLTLRPRLIALIEQCGWKIVTYLNSDRLVTFVCGRVEADDSVEVIQLDFFFHTSVFGLVLVENKELLATRQFNGILYHVSPAYAFLDKYTYCRAVGAAYPEKYRATREAVANDATVLNTIKDLFGTSSLEACDTMTRSQLLREVLRANLRRYNLRTLTNYLRFEYHHIKNYVCSNTGFSLGFTGPDGSGKTTVIDLLIKNFGSVFATAHAYYHFRPMLFGNLGEAAHAVGLKKEVDRNFSEPHRGGKTGVFSSLLRLAYYSTDYILGYFSKVKPKTRLTRLVIFDRYFTDIICDSRRSRIYLNTQFLYTFSRWLIPSLDYNILLTAPTDTILARKQELDAEGIAAINSKIDFLADKPGYYKILNTGTPQEAVAKILRLVFEQQHSKNLRRMR